MNKELKDLAKKAYVYFYPFVTMEMTRLQFLYTDPNRDIGVAGAGPMNRLGHLRSFPLANNKNVVRVNFDTLYSTGWLDLSDGPVVVSVGENKNKRFYELPMYDMWSDAFAIPGSRTHGYSAHSWLVVPNGWSGEVPDDLTVITAPTNYVWIIGRTQANGNDDKYVHEFQDSITVKPYKNWLDGSEAVLKQPEPRTDVDTITPVTFIVNKMDAASYYNTALEVLLQNPPHLTDWSIINQLSKYGIEAGRKFDDLTPEIKQVFSDEMSTGLQSIYDATPFIAKVINGWQMNTNVMGVYGNEYLKRAVIALIGLGANPPEEAIYPFGQTDNNGDILNAESNYVVHFSKEDLPPVNAFWSLTMYDADGFQVENEINRFAIGDRNNLYYNEDGSLTIYIQAARPEDKLINNWLPSPQVGELGLTMRLYNPQDRIITGEWVPPVIQKNK